MRITITEIILFFVLAVAIASDLRWRKIPNWLTGPSILIGLGLHTFINQWRGLVVGLEGAALGLGLFFLVYVAGWMGAGDVKLYAAVGSFLGPAHTISAAIVIALIGGLLAFAMIGFHLGWRGMGFWLWSHIQGMFLTGSAQVLTPLQSAAPKVPYALAIGLGTIGSYWWFPLG